MVKGRVFLHAQDERLLPLVGDLAAALEPDDALQLRTLRLFGRQSELQGWDRFGRIFWGHAVMPAQQMNGDGAFLQAL